jgi:putative hydrolases of HD superfamily
MEMNEIAKYLYEIGQLKRVKRAGWWMIGITAPESVAEHSFRTALLGYVLASLAGADAKTTAVMCLFHDTAESRINDLHLVAKRYLQQKEGEQQAWTEQVKSLPTDLAQQILGFVETYEGRTSLEAQVAHDADALECLIQAREYQLQGYADAQEWITNCYASLKTEAAKHLADACLRVDPSAWWREIKPER